MTNTLYNALFAPHTMNNALFLTLDDGRKITYAAFVARIAQIAHVLTAAGVKAGDRVVVQAPKLFDTLALYGATLQVGGVYLPLNTAYTHSELQYFIDDAAPACVVCEHVDFTAVRGMCDAKTSIFTLSSSRRGTLSESADQKAETFDAVKREPDDLAGLLYTSGTTGRSKGAMMSHKNLLSNALTLKDLWQISAADRLIHALPIFHTHGLFVAMNTALLAGAEVRFMSNFDIETMITELPFSTLLMGVPTFYTRLLNESGLSSEQIRRMRLFISGSAPLLAETHQAFEERTGHRILERYGMTETNMITSNPYEGERVAGTVGYALPGCEVVITKGGVPVSNGEIGMIEVRGDNVFQGYWNMPEKTAEELRENGFFVTGDLGVMSEDGRVSIVGRQKDLIISGGYNIYPKEIEDVINSIPDVVESAVYGVPDPDLGESVVATVVLANKATTVTEIETIVAENLARFKRPRCYLFADALPLNAMGKVQKNVLRDLHGSASKA